MKTVNSKKILSLILVFLTVLLTSSCRKVDEKSDKLKIVTTLFPQYDFARIIAGDKAEVIKIIPWGSESHTYDPSVKDISEVSKADIYIYTGKDIEPWAATLAENTDSNAAVVDLSQNITLLEYKTDNNDGENPKHQHHSHDYDSHIWTNPKNAAVMANDILNAICNADSQNADYYKANAGKLKAEIAELDSELCKISDLYDGRTIYFGGRFAFLYMFEQYGLKYKSAYLGCGEETEPGIKTISELCDSIKREKARYIFGEELSEGKIANAISEETGAKILVLHSCHNLSLSEAESGESYVSIMKKNIENLKLAVGIEQ